MDQAPQTAILLISDPLFRGGLKLLLEDMHYMVSSSGNFLEIERFLYTCKVAPSLFIFPLILDNGKTAIEFVRTMRKRFDASIPVILLRPDNTVYQPQLTDADLIVLPEQTKPDVLRQKINEISSTNKKMSVELEHGD